MITMVKGNNEDVFTPFLWGMPKAMDYWRGLAKIDMMAHACLMEGYCVGALKGESWAESIALATHART